MSRLAPATPFSSRGNHASMALPYFLLLPLERVKRRSFTSAWLAARADKSLTWSERQALKKKEEEAAASTKKVLF